MRGPGLGAHLLTGPLEGAVELFGQMHGRVR
jgi:hypothetical protein